MFEDQTVELLPARTTMKRGGNGRFVDVSQVGNVSIAIAINAGNINFGGTQVNVAEAVALAGSNVGG
ncbi:hypothetical protein ACI79J_02275 [Geodermatophilus sp. SYSU D01062]